MKAALIAAVSGLIAGCAGPSGILPKHEDSLVTEDEVLCLSTKASPDELAVASIIMAPVVKALAGAGIDAIAGAIEKESKLYKATYTARLPEKLFRSYKSGGEDRVKLRFTEITFTRYAGDPNVTSCEDAGNAVPAMRLTVAVAADAAEGNLRLTPKELVYRQSRAKVAAWDHKLDVNAQLQMVAIVSDKDGKKSNSDFVKVDFPLGRLPIGKNYMADERKLKPLASGWFALPAVAKPAAPTEFGAVTIIVTVMESDNLGDVLAKGAKKVRDSEDKVADKVLDKLGLKEE